MTAATYRSLVVTIAASRHYKAEHHTIMPRPHTAEALSDYACLKSVCLTSVCHIHRAQVENREA